MRLMRVVGARPQFMQVPVLRDRLVRLGHDHVLVHTGQHYDDMMNDVFFRELNLPSPDYQLEISGLSHGAMTGRMMEGIEALLKKDRPDALLVDGDTNSTAAAALAAVKMGVPVVHIEAGLRDFDRKRPEEINRIVTDHVATLNCAPIPRAHKNLVHEGLEKTGVLVGDLLLDCFLYFHRKAMNSGESPAVKGLKRYHLATLHRPENTDPSEAARFHEIMAVLTRLDAPVIFPVHPRTRAAVNRWVEAEGSLGNVQPIEPVGYFQMLSLLKGADCVFTDSGGLPREAIWTGCRCVMLFRKETWHDMLENNWAQIGMTDSASIEKAYSNAVRPDPQKTQAFFGAGRAAEAIAQAMIERIQRH